MDQLDFDEVASWETPPLKGNSVSIGSLGSSPIWTETKALLIKKYLRLFLFITKHGTYIDGFAGHQYSDAEDAWAAKLVLEMEPKWLRHFYLSELNRTKFKTLKQMVDGQESSPPKRTVELFSGDCNAFIPTILDRGEISDKEATFALLDQHSLECHWSTVTRLAGYKPSGNKIELFYFFPTGWLSRALHALKNEELALNWWGDESWKDLLGMKSSDQVAVMRDRIQALGYADVKDWPITKRYKGEGRVMYHMIHATDHLEAPKLMFRAYKQLVGHSSDAHKQIGFDLN
ncbi:MAG: hypothetical protein DHS20C12_11590 [Pseudohongiella sp.]|nr:MAG: hypothetical protein DHS20C12_11590 [Pseudohongiella sp.]